MSFLKHALDSSDDEDSNLFRHSERNFDAILAEQRQNRLEKSQQSKTPSTAAASVKKSGKRKSDALQADEDNAVELEGEQTPCPSPKRTKAGESDGHDVVQDPAANLSPARDATPPTHPPVKEPDDFVDRATGKYALQPDDLLDSDDEFADIVRRARRARQLKSTGNDPNPTPVQSIETTALGSPQKATSAEPVIEIFISSHLPHTRPLRIMVRLSQQLGLVRQAWCRKQGFDDDGMTRDVFLVYKLRKMYDMSTCRSLGLDVDANGRLTMKGKHANEEASSIHVQAATEEIFQRMKDGTLSEDGPQPQDSAPPEAAASTPSAVNPSGKMNLILRTSHRADFKVATKPGTSIGKIVRAYRKIYSIDPGTSISLTFDGEELADGTFVRDTELTDMDIVDVRIG